MNWWWILKSVWRSKTCSCEEQQMRFSRTETLPHLQHIIIYALGACSQDAAGFCWFRHVAQTELAHGDISFLTQRLTWLPEQLVQCHALIWCLLVVKRGLILARTTATVSPVILRMHWNCFNVIQNRFIGADSCYLVWGEYFRLRSQNGRMVFKCI